MVAKKPLRFDPIDEARRHWDDRWQGGAAMEAATSIMRVQQIVLARVDRALRPFELTFARYEALVLLAFSRRGSLPLGKMGERLMIHPASVTNVVDRLEAQGYVRRVPHPDDRRATLCEITDDGRSILKKATHAVIEAQFGMGALDPDDLARLTTLLRGVRAAEGDFVVADPDVDNGAIDDDRRPVNPSTRSGTTARAAARLEAPARPAGRGRATPP